MNKSNKSSLFKASLVATLLAGALNAQAAGLGKLTVYSAIGQTLNAELALTASPEELNSLSAKLASNNAFKEAGIEFMPALSGLRFNVVKSPAGQAILRLTTDTPLNEPFLHFLVELNWATGRMVREYTFLLDPPEILQASKPAAVVAPAVPAASAPPQASALPPLAPKAKAAAPATLSEPQKSPKPAVVSQADAQEYHVKAGDTLGKIARANKTDTVTLDQMLVALFNSNREVFDGGNMNRLRAGKILRVPDVAAAAAVDAGEARKLVIGQAADFNAYRRRLAEAAATAPVAETAPQQQVTGKIKPEVESKAPAAPVRDKLEVSRTETTQAGKPAKSSLEADLIARDKALREAAERIAQLEKSLDNLKQLVEIKSQGGAQLQQQSKPAAAAQPEKMPEPPAPAAAKPAEPAAPVEKPVEPPAAGDKPAAAPKKPAPPPPPPPPEPSFVEDNPELVFGGGGLIALLLGFFGYTAWRKKKKAGAVAADSLPAFEAPASPVLAAAAVASAAPEPEVSILGDFSESGALTAEENVDPVAEADVLMAYGRDAQAEEILQEGLKTDPTRAAIHLKLLELYAHRQDAAQFESVATELFALCNGAGSEWEKAVAMAQGMGITHGVFAAGGALAEAEASYPAAEAEPAREEAPALATGAAAAPAAEAMQEPVAEAGGAGLDFDLDLGTTSAPAAAAAIDIATATPASAAEEVMSLDFDFDLGTSEPAAAEASAVAAEIAPVVEEPPAAAESDANAIDFSLDIGAAPEAEPAAQPVAEDAAAAENEIEFDLDLGSSESAVEPAAAPVAEEMSDFDVQLDIGSVGESATEVASAELEAPVALDLAGISLDLGEPEAAAVPALESEASALELPDVQASSAPESAEAADFDLDLGMDIGSAAPAEVSEPVVPAVKPVMAPVELPDIELALDTDASPVAGELDAGDLGGMDFDLGTDEAADVQPAAAESEPDDPEVATKLELAQAYEEMGDREGARELLNEVLNEGSTAQQAAARAKLEQLSI